MRKETFILCLTCLLLLLSGCQPKAEPTPGISPTTPVPEETNIPTATATPTKNNTPTLGPTVIAPTQPALSLTDLEDTLIDGVDWYFQVESSDGTILLSRNFEASFHPASMIKVPTAMVVLKILENEGKTLADIQSYGVSGRNFADLLEAMIVRSEESATDALEFYARGDNRLRKILDQWGLTETTYDPRRSTVKDLMTSLRLLDSGDALSAEYQSFLLDLMGRYTEYDAILLGKLLVNLPGCQFLNKRGTLLNPTIASDMGILRCGEQSWYLVVAGTPADGSTRTFEDIQASIEAFALAFGDYILHGE